MLRRLAASVLDCGKRRIWVDPSHKPSRFGNSRKSIRRLVKNCVIVRKPIRAPSRYRVRVRTEAKKKGRHTGLGKRQGTANARTPEKMLWMRRLRVLRRLLKKYRDTKRIDRNMYHQFYLRAKGNQFKNKRVLMEAIYSAKAEAIKQKAVKEQLEARRARNNAATEKKRLKSHKKKQERVVEAVASATH